jgi:phytoene dehydrogenase-like protein
MALCSNGILDFGLRGALFGASLGGVVGLTKGFFGERSKNSVDPTVRRVLQRCESLPLDGDFNATVTDLGEYRKFDVDAYAAIVEGANRMVAIHTQLLAGKIPAKASTPRLLSLASAKVVEGVRSVRAAFQKACPGRPTDLETFDEIAGAAQKFCNDYMHNVVLHVQSAMGSS